MNSVCGSQLSLLEETTAGDSGVQGQWQVHGMIRSLQEEAK